MNFIEHSLANPLSAESVSTQLSDGTQLNLLETGILRVSPPNTGGYRIVISCGIHGNETAPIELVEQMVSDIANGHLQVRNEILFVFGNPRAANNESRFVEENLNRLFSGKHLHSNSLEASRAKLIEQHVDLFFLGGSDDEQRLHYDLHTAIRGSRFRRFAVYPFLHKRSWSKPQLAFLEYCGIEAVLLSNQPAGTFSYFSSHTYGAHAFTLELGKVKKFGENNLSDFEAVVTGLRQLIAGTETFTHSGENIQIFSVVEEVIKRSENFKLHIEDDAENFTEFDKGSLLASDLDYEYRTQQNGERFVFPISNVPIGQRAMLVVAPTEL